MSTSTSTSAITTATAALGPTAIEQARGLLVARKARELGAPDNLALAEWALGIEALLKDLGAIMDERHLALLARLDDAVAVARGAWLYAREWEGERDGDGDRPANDGEDEVA